VFVEKCAFNTARVERTLIFFKKLTGFSGNTAGNNGVQTCSVRQNVRFGLNRTKINYSIEGPRKAHLLITGSLCTFQFIYKFGVVLLEVDGIFFFFLTILFLNQVKAHHPKIIIGKSINKSIAICVS
jgi:hypothetical protein